MFCLFRLYIGQPHCGSFDKISSLIVEERVEIECVVKSFYQGTICRTHMICAFFNNTHRSWMLTFSLFTCTGLLSSHLPPYNHRLGMVDCNHLLSRRRCLLWCTPQFNYSRHDVCVLCTCITESAVPLEALLDTGSTIAILKCGCLHWFHGLHSLH